MSATASSAHKAPAKKGWLTRMRQRNVLPGFGLSMGITVFSLSLLVVLPFAISRQSRSSNPSRSHHGQQRPSTPM